MRRGAVGPLDRVVAGPAAVAAGAALPSAIASALPPEATDPVDTAAGSPESAPTVSCNRSAGTVSALTPRNAAASATTGA